MEYKKMKDAIYLRVGKGENLSVIRVKLSLLRQLIP